MDAWDVIEWLAYTAYYGEWPIGRGPYFMEILTTIVSLVTLPLLGVICTMGINRFNLILKQQADLAEVTSDLSARMVRVETQQEMVAPTVARIEAKLDSVIQNDRNHG